MYIKITTRCNMKCSHCCFSCGANGSDMSFRTFKLLLKRWAKLINEKNQYIVLGGGEPTLHQEFWKFVEYAMSQGYVWIATNGSKIHDSLALSDLARKGYLHAVLSIDEFHEPIDRSVIDSFSDGLTPQQCGMWNITDSYDQREIRTVTNPYQGGRCDDGIPGCPCNGIQIEPDGKIKACGCQNAPYIGSVSKGITDKNFYDYDLFEGCFKKSGIPEPVFNHSTDQLSV